MEFEGVSMVENVSKKIKKKKTLCEKRKEKNHSEVSATLRALYRELHVIFSFIENKDYLFKVLKCYLYFLGYCMILWCKSIIKDYTSQGQMKQNDSNMCIG